MLPSPGCVEGLSVNAKASIGGARDYFGGKWGCVEGAMDNLLGRSSADRKNMTVTVTSHIDLVFNML